MHWRGEKERPEESGFASFSPLFCFLSPFRLFSFLCNSNETWKEKEKGSPKEKERRKSDSAITAKTTQQLQSKQNEGNTHTHTHTGRESARI
jgi:hypothetical protein